MALLGATALFLGAERKPAVGADVDWPAYGGATGSRYSELTQINAGNVARLKQVWRYELDAGGLQTSPLVVGRMLYGYTPNQTVIALDAATGALRWAFDAKTPSFQPARGLSWWSDGKDRRLLAGVKDALYALDPDTGRPILSFGDGGKIDLNKDLDRYDRHNVVFLTSPGVIYKDLIIVGLRTAEQKPAAPGSIRAYDVRTGKLRWIFHTIPHPGEPGYETWPAEAWKTGGGANNWAGMVVDAERGIVFAPTGSAVDDMYGADRRGDDLYADTLLALDAATGRLIWHFQGVHHDIWDRDFPSPPVLVTVRRGGKRIDAVAQTTKQGFVFVFERATGKPLFPIEERPFAASTVPGEHASPTQPVPLAPEPFARQRLTEDMLTTRTPQAHAFAVKAFAGMVSGGPYTPLQADKPTVVFPGFDGGGEWGGPAVDPRGVLYVNANDLAWTGSLSRTDPARAGSAGAATYQANCASCHGPDRKGSPPEFPSLVGIGERMGEKEIADLLTEGRGRMPAFPAIDDRKELLEYLRDPTASAEGRAPPDPAVTASQPAYRFRGYMKFVDQDGYPAVRPPWGTLSAIDLNTGRYLWRTPLGEYPELAAKGVRDTGSENSGGPIVTAGGLLIIGATTFDHQSRAFDPRTGKLLWRADLPYAGNATPITYKVDGRQYIVIGTTSQRSHGGPWGAAYVAFALPDR